MANQPPPRPWLRLGSMRAPPPPPPAPTPAPEAPQVQPAQPRPIVRPAFGQTFRPTAQPQQPAPAPAVPFRVGTVSVPSSPVKTTASVPSSPVMVKSAASVPSSPVEKTSATSLSVPTSPAVKTATTTSAVPMATLSSLPPSPVRRSPSPPKRRSPSPPKRASPVFKITTTSSSVPTSPVSRPTVPQPQPQPPTSPTTKVISTTIVPQSIPPPAPAPAPALLFGFLPQTTSTPPQEKTKPTAPPPSPLSLPPQIKPTAEPEQKIEQKTVLVQETIEKPKTPFKLSDSGLHSIVRDQTKDTEIETKDQHKGIIHRKKTDTDDLGMKIITIAGDNKGAIMELSPSRKKPDSESTISKKVNLKTLFGTKIGSDSSSEDDGSTKKDKNKNISNPSPPMNAFMNSNVQAVNNSILFHASCTHHDPGVHVVVTRGNGRGLHIKDAGHGQNN